MSAEVLVAGMRFGRWTVIGSAGIMLSVGRISDCQCDCGIKRKIDNASLNAGLTRECCGCYRRYRFDVLPLSHEYKYGKSDWTSTVRMGAIGLVRRYTTKRKNLLEFCW